MTVPTNLSDYHHPSIVLELLLNLPMECHMGIGHNLKPMIDKAIAEQNKIEQLQMAQQQQNQQQQHQLIEPQLNGNNEHKDDNYHSQVEIVPAAPLAIPPTAPSNGNMGNMGSINNEAYIDSLDDLGFGDDIDFASLHDEHDQDYLHHKKPSPMRRRPSIKQFESVLQEGYTKNLMLAVIQALFGAFLSGYNTSVLNTPSAIIQSECQLNLEQYSSLQSFFCVGGLIGALSIGKIADAYGRKIAILMFDIVFIISGLVVAFYAFFIDKSHPNSWILFAIARSLSGIGAGIATAIIPTYLGEISPPLIRGAIGTLNQLTVCIGLVIAELFGGIPIFKDASLWPWLFALNLVLPIIQIVTFWSFPESPKWLITKLDEEEARKVLEHLRECSNVDMDLHFTKLVNRFQQRKRTLSRGSLLSVHTVSEQESLLKHQRNSNNNNNYGSTNKKESHSKGKSKTRIEVTDNVHSVQQSSTDNQMAEEENRQLRRILKW
eukprot:CAMPEP_0201573740 /NCGR_PEP_ID=MMETSP0190_2-20130828/17756_1 /ASSEMBLY_ACC=CAM_ASM_000263 /TAXON_ID=37353 /ORGANISM="Rosalina sp." /LENGTH=490 /DNA_ID=CAMNT_0048001053 /DNA_START=220 /DNA_END=1689 /DNA_ORIENTATION=+